MNKALATNAPTAILRPAVWSNVFFLLPLFLAFSFGNLALLLLISCVFIASSTYHFLSEKNSGVLLSVDRTFAGILILFNAGLVAFGGFTPPYFYWVLVFVGSATYFFRKQRETWSNGSFDRYELYHSLWHLTSVAITIFSIYTFYSNGTIGSL